MTASPLPKPRHPDLTRRRLVELAAASAAVLPIRRSMAQDARPPRRPNLVVIFSDQQHWQALGCVDAFFDTPALDALAAEGVLFEQCTCTTPQCSPSRSSLLTGLYPSKTGVWGNIGAAGGRKLKMPTLAPRLQKAGYHTGYFGKWHLGNEPVAQAGWDDASFRSRDPNTTKQALAFVQRAAKADKPFALFVSYLDPHDIYYFRRSNANAADAKVPLPVSWHKETFGRKPAVQKQFMTDDQGTAIWGKPKAAWQRYRAFYREKVKLYDGHAGKVLAALKQAGVWDDTIVLLTSDHGDMDTQHKLIFKGPFMYEHMVRIPLIARVPKAFGGRAGAAGKPRRIAEPTVNVDIAPTLLDFAGADTGDLACDGFSLRPALTGTGPMPKRDFVVSEYYSKQRWVNPIRMLRTSRWKYIRYRKHGEELYDLQADPHELTNLAGQPEHAKVQADLSAKLDAWMKTHNDPFPTQWPTDRKGHPLPKK